MNTTSVDNKEMSILEATRNGRAEMVKFFLEAALTFILTPSISLSTVAFT